MFVLRVCDRAPGSKGTERNQVFRDHERSRKHQTLRYALASRPQIAVGDIREQQSDAKGTGENPVCGTTKWNHPVKLIAEGEAESQICQWESDDAFSSTGEMQQEYRPQPGADGDGKSPV